MLNSVNLIGRLTKDPELRYTTNGNAVCTFTLAVDRDYKNAQGERETDFIPCVAYRQTAENAANNLAKGKMASVGGRIQVRTYDGQDGQKRWVTEIIANSIYFLTPREQSSQGANPHSNNQGNFQGANNQPANRGNQGWGQNNAGNFGGNANGYGGNNGSNDFGNEVPFADDDIPF